MSLKGNIKKILLVLTSIVVGAGLCVLLVAAINKKNHKNCTGLAVTINSREDMKFLSQQEVIRLLAPDSLRQPKGRSLASFDLKKMETAVKKNIWVRDAQLFFDNNGVLHVNVDERWPVARVFTLGGNSFYLDSTGKRLPLKSNMTVKLPVFSSFPSDRERWTGADSSLARDVVHLSIFLLGHPFWMAQIGQTDITANGSFEMMPVIGKHLIVFGDGSEYEQKFHRLMLFYQQVSAKTGMDKYSSINVSFNGQVVATRKAYTGKIDSIQALKNVKNLIESSRRIADDTVSTMVDNNIVANPVAAPTLTILKDNQKNSDKKDSLNTQAPASSNVATGTRRNNATHSSKPKALMKKPVPG